MKATAILTPHDRERAEFGDGLAALNALAAAPPPDVVERFADLEEQFHALAGAERVRLLETSLAWTPDEQDAADWLHRAHVELALLAFRVWESIRHDDASGRTSRHMTARALLHFGDAGKWAGVVSEKPVPRFSRLHAMMRAALAGGFQSARLPVVREGGLVTMCNVEALYFRALLLARFSSGTFTLKQLEILDQWMWQWTTVLAGTDEAPADGAFRADLDSDEGLRPGPRADAGPSRYLRVVPIQQAYSAIVAQFHQGRIVPEEGIASRFRIEEYVAVLDLARSGLRGVAAAGVGRAGRTRHESEVQLLVGLPEIMRHGFLDEPAPPVPEGLTLAAREGAHVSREDRSHDRRIEGLFDVERRTVRVLDSSASGFGIEGEATEVAPCLVGALVALRLADGRPPVICKVVRRLPAPGSTRVFLGLRRITSSARPVSLKWPGAMGPRESNIAALFVPGEDASGRHDGWLVSEREFTRRLELEANVGDRCYSLRFNRVRLAGPGWVLAGFEILSAARAAA